MRVWLNLIVLAAAACAAARAEVSATEAQALKSELTPLGAERAGNAAGTIPAWSATPSAAGLTQEKPVLVLTQRNFREHADQLPEGAKALFAKYADYRMDVYPSHRTATAPQWVYDNTYRNATRAHAASEGIAYGVDGAAGGIPFPIPKNGFEAMWNHLLAFWGPARELHVCTYVVAADGTMEKASSYRETADFPYYYRDATPQSFGGYYFKTLHLQDAPPDRVGQGYLNWQPIDIARYPFAAWRLLAGEHRARKAPSISYDVPDPDAGGFESLDEYYLFFGGLDHYDFKLLGKKEMIVPYHNERLTTRPVREIMGPHHANPDDIRYELHRVWVVEGTLAKGQNDIVARRRLYLDEDTWMAVYSDAWDAQGVLWKFGQASMVQIPELPAVVIGPQFVYDFELGGYLYGFAWNGEPQGYKVSAPHPASLFMPESMAVRAVR
ncbi:MAG TPA: DUF1329 domain-containing protein [Rhizomicrobium sp.]|nr:DUF1329 domain-containing protein [Rhizomicrobium sp.]